ncbi:MAG: hypothetical protein ABS46_09980 [Cytophagaceae bacterium SCN 52-12]|nr:MAG: hypothetical protein ABS46_09980 [Cytophagaceae bacterium SCN 52-12]
MKQFSSITEAFAWWLKNVYPTLPAERKKGRLTYAWRDFSHGGSITEKRMRVILEEFGDIEIQTVVRFTPK